jgi:hypothetical protein
MQVSGPYILGRITVDSYFLLNASTGEKTDLETYDEFREAAVNSKIKPALVPIDSLYSKYRFTWFDAFAAFLLSVPPLIAFAVQIRWGRKQIRPRIIADEHG